MLRQKELNLREQTTTTDVLQDLHKVVRTVDGQTLTIQQVICGMTNEEGYRIFTGAERMGTANRILLTFDREIANTAHMVARKARVVDAGDFLF